MPDLVTCPDCSGRGHIARFVDGAEGGRYEPELRCLRCKGAKTITQQEAEWIVRGWTCMERRRAGQESLRDAAQRFGMQPVDVSQMEHGKRDPAPLEEAWKA